MADVTIRTCLFRSRRFCLTSLFRIRKPAGKTETANAKMARPLSVLHFLAHRADRTVHHQFPDPAARFFDRRLPSSLLCIWPGLCHDRRLVRLVGLSVYTVYRFYPEAKFKGLAWIPVLGPVLVLLGGKTNHA